MVKKYQKSMIRTLTFDVFLIIGNRWDDCDCGQKRGLENQLFLVSGIDWKRFNCSTLFPKEQQNGQRYLR